MEGKSTDGIVSRYLNRKISTRITSFIMKHDIPCTPNDISIISFIIGLLAFPFYLLHLPWVAGLLIQVSSVVDGVDGELARARNMKSDYGAFLDTMLDRFANILAILGASIYVGQVGEVSTTLLLVVSILAVTGDLMVSYLHSVGKVFGTHPVLVGRIGGIASRDVRLFILFVFSLSGQVFLALLIIALLSNFYVVGKFMELLYHCRDVKKQ